ncbi:hypothetical protein K435DRAFT_874785 [Dendrothele bispora CBS 962.96]|uniref:Uncharacterized protein n=1 Tax=Dendrothele bispora (strain CBS 962.96) TaxID=1314807 RepID=A0A4S8KW66_DENBC|nr:hypothetical protein K435DRAFT_874785 [Dendrothele bispora CBS 962.96]
MELKKTSPLNFTTVLVAQNADGPITTLTATPKDQLARVSVESTFELNYVGKNLIHHPLVLTYYSINSNTMFDDTIRESDHLASNLELWEDKREGLFSTTPMTLSSGPRSTHIELLFTNGFAALGGTKQPDEGPFLTVIAAIVSLKSMEGSLTLTSAEDGIVTHPNIDYGLLTNEFDLIALQQALLNADTLLTLHLDGTDADKEAYIKKNLITVYRPVGTWNCQDEF